VHALGELCWPCGARDRQSRAPLFGDNATSPVGMRAATVSVVKNGLYESVSTDVVSPGRWVASRGDVRFRPRFSGENAGIYQLAERCRTDGRVGEDIVLQSPGDTDCSSVKE